MRAREMSLEEQVEYLRRGTVEIVSEDELKEKLKISRREKRPLRVKLGLDPSAPDIHLGHVVVLRKLRHFQELGHEVICLIGDFTGRIGDPSGKSETRVQLSEAEVQANAETYADQVFKILDPEKTVIDFNSRWLGEMAFAEVVELAAKMTVARMLERDDFAGRYENQKPIYVHEFFYPLMQAYDSVALEADVELGGTDQRFNLMMTRHIQREFDQAPEVLVITPLIEGTDGVRKMSKSLGNYVGIDEAPGEMYGKLMSIPDGLIAHYLELVTDVPVDEIESMTAAMESGELNPRDAKMRLAREVVTQFHNQNEAELAEEDFVKVFRRGRRPEEMPAVTIADSDLDDGKIWVIDLIRRCGFADSNSQARRLVEQGAVRLDGERVGDVHAALRVEDGAVLRVGKRRFASLQTGDE